MTKHLSCASRVGRGESDCVRFQETIQFATYLSFNSSFIPDQSISSKSVWRDDPILFEGSRGKIRSCKWSLQSRLWVASDMLKTVY